MEKELHEATIKGNVNTLLRLIQQDPLILDRNYTRTAFLETPLHISAMLGHTGFSFELLRLKPELAQQLDVRRSTPLHLASSKGHLDVVKVLLQYNPETCFSVDREGMNPLHVAAMMGRTEVLRELVLAKPDAAKALMKQEKSIMHLCIEYFQLDALKLLLETRGLEEMINYKDTNCNTILHLAVADKQAETTDFLLGITGIEVNALNLDGMTAMDILIQRRWDARDSQIERSLNHAGANGTRDNMNSNTSALSHNVVGYKNDAIDNNRKQINDWLEQQKNALMVVASLTGTMAFQVGMNPPGGVWQEDKGTIEAGTPILLTKQPDSYNEICLLSTISFFASLSLVLMLMSGFPIRRRGFMWILMGVVWIVITTIAFTYARSLIVFSPLFATGKIVLGVICGWIFLMSFLLLGHAFRLIKRLRNWIKKRMNEPRNVDVL